MIEVRTTFDPVLLHPDGRSIMGNYGQHPEPSTLLDEVWDIKSFIKSLVIDATFIASLEFVETIQILHFFLNTKVSFLKLIPNLVLTIQSENKITGNSRPFEA